MLPKIEMPTFAVNLLSDSSVTVTMRPMTIKQEKLLLMAKEERSDKGIVSTLIDILQACVVTDGKTRSDGTVNVGDYPLCDIEWMFLKLRAQSVGNVADLSYVISEETFDFKVDLNKVKPKAVERKAMDNMIKIGGDSDSIELKYTPSKVFADSIFDEDKESEQLDLVLASSIAAINIGDTKTDPSTLTSEELTEWINSLPAGVLKKCQDFLQNTPRLYHAEKVKTKDGKEHVIELQSLNDFFII